MTAHEAYMSPHDDTIERLAVLVACGLADDSVVDASTMLIDEADHDGPGRVLATVDGREYLITIAANTEQPGVTGPDRSNWRHLYVDRKGRLFADMCVDGDAQLVASCHVDDWGDPYTLEQIEAQYGPLKLMGRIA